jgi:beta-fructofuranosidase
MGKLMQKPVSAMQELRYNEKEISDENKASQQYEAELTIKAGQKGSLYPCRKR